MISGTIKAEILSNLKELSGVKPEQRIKNRIEKLSKMGVYNE